MNQAASQPEMSYRGVPTAGQLVEVRHRQWLVSDVIGSELTSSRHQQNLVMLSSVDADALDERLQVIWEIEPGARIVERAGLPSITGKDDTETLEAFLDAIRWGAATNADKGFLQAPFRSGVSIEDFQLDPVVRAIDMARVNLLIADDVGLGKTIEAGLVIQELLLRHRARKVLVVCPASLQEKWRMEMLEKFGLEFRIVDTEYVKQLRRQRGIHANPWSSFSRLITSVDWLKTGEPLRMFRDLLPVRATYPREFDILVVDEAHNVSPAGSANYVVDSERTRLIRTIAPHFQHKLFLTATPHNGYKQSFTSLLELLDDQRFSRNIEPDEKQLSQVLVRRLKSSLLDKEGKPIYPKRVLLPLSIEFSKDERDIHALLSKYSASREKTCSDARMAATFVNGLLKKRLLSSPAAFASTLERHTETLARGGAEKKISINPERILKRALQKSEEDYAKDREVEEAQQEALEEATKAVAGLTPEERELLDKMRHWAQRNKDRVDSKANAIIAWLKNNLRDGEHWNDKKVILFTEYRTTLHWLHAILASHGLGGDRLALIHGEVDHEDREKIKASFQSRPEESPIRILLATDAASEGIDLQNYCNFLIHVEIPYNPNVMEQRNGRIDRHGQKQSEVHIWHPVDGGDLSQGTKICGHESDIIRALKKLEAMREDMGSVNPVIAPQMAGLIEGDRKDLDTQEAEVRAQKSKRYLKVEGKIRERVEELHKRLMETRDAFHLSPERILQSVRVGLALAGKPPLRETERSEFPKGTVFEMPALSGSWSQCLEGLAHPHNQRIRPITFDHSVAKGRDDVVLVHLNHRLVQMCLRTMREEVWKRDDIKKLHRVDVRTLDDPSLEGPAVVIISRLVVTGGGHHRLHEELVATGGYLKEKSFARATKVSQADTWLETAQPHPNGAAVLDDLRARFAKQEDAIQGMIEARSKERLSSLFTVLETKKKQEIGTLEKILDDLSKAIIKEINEDPASQLELFSPDERMQLKRDVESLKLRLSRIPEEKEQETVEIERRYLGLAAQTFPIAVIFLVPKSYESGRTS